MNQRQTIIAAVVATPGSTMREIARAIGLSERANVTGVSAQLSQLCTVGKVRRDDPANPSRNPPRYWATESADKDLRAGPRTPAQRAQRAEAAMKREEAKRARRLSNAQKQATYTSDKARPPKAASQITVAKPLPPPAAPAMPARKFETVDEFLKRGGRIQTLGAFETSNPLRFDHSNGSALNRPVRRTRVAVAP